MPTYVVTAPDGKKYRVTAPEGASEQEVMARVAKPGKQAKKPTSFWQGVAEGVAEPFNNAARALEYGAEKIGVAGALNSVGEALGMAPSVERAEQNQQQRIKKSPYRGSGAGKFVGNIAGTLPTALIPGGAFAQGAAAGALLTKSRDLPGIATDALIGGAAGKAGELATRGIARAINPRVAPVVKRLKEQGVRMTPGQIMGAKDTAVGRVVKATEDKASSIPVVGDLISGARRRSVEDFNRAALGEPLKSIGKALPKTAGIGHEGIAHVERELGKAYDDILPKLSATGDSQFLDDLVNIHSEAQTMAPQRAEQFNSILKDLSRFWKPGNILSGKDLKAVEARLGDRIRNYGSGADPDARDLANALRQVQGSIRDLAARQNPAEAARLNAINEGWAKFTRAQRAAAFSKEGIFTPGQLATAARTMDKSGRKAATARGEGLMQGLAEDAQSVLPSAIPDSGTAGRLLPLILGGTGYISPPAAIAGGAAMLPYTSAGGRAAEWLLTGRQGEAARGLSDLVRSSAPVMIGGAATLPAQ